MAARNSSLLPTRTMRTSGSAGSAGGRPLLLDRQQRRKRLRSPRSRRCPLSSSLGKDRSPFLRAVTRPSERHRPSHHHRLRLSHCLSHRYPYLYRRPLDAQMPFLPLLRRLHRSQPLLRTLRPLLAHSRSRNRRRTCGPLDRGRIQQSSPPSSLC